MIPGIKGKTEDLGPACYGDTLVAAADAVCGAPYRHPGDGPYHPAQDRAGACSPPRVGLLAGQADQVTLVGVEVVQVQPPAGPEGGQHRRRDNRLPDGVDL